MANAELQLTAALLNLCNWVTRAAGSGGGGWGGGGVKLATAAGRSRVHTAHRHRSVNNRLQAHKADKTQPTRQLRLLAESLACEHVSTERTKRTNERTSYARDAL